jgi:hypothetical protein
MEFLDYKTSIIRDEETLRGTPAGVISRKLITASAKC